MVNSFILYKEYYQGKGLTPLPYLEFRKQLMRELLGTPLEPRPVLHVTLMCIKAVDNAAMKATEGRRRCRLCHLEGREF